MKGREETTPLIQHHQQHHPTQRHDQLDIVERPRVDQEQDQQEQDQQAAAPPHIANQGFHDTLLHLRPVLLFVAIVIAGIVLTESGTVGRDVMLIGLGVGFNLGVPVYSWWYKIHLWFDLWAFCISTSCLLPITDWFLASVTKSLVFHPTVFIPRVGTANATQPLTMLTLWSIPLFVGLVLALATRDYEASIRHATHSNRRAMHLTAPSATATITASSAATLSLQSSPNMAGATAATRTAVSPARATTNTTSQQTTSWPWSLGLKGSLVSVLAIGGGIIASEIPAAVYGLWGPSESVKVLIGGASVYVVPAELVLGMSSFAAYALVEGDRYERKALMAFVVMLLYTGSMAVSFAVIEGGNV
ncbi:hypothetical protein HDU76_006376 [Blyttiomyces sp. JEL0837]|nr:hypothetical protein HDU76_006376 [Blyttiomyces sp. JEL0837]